MKAKPKRDTHYFTMVLDNPHIPRRATKQAAVDRAEFAAKNNARAYGIYKLVGYVDCEVDTRHVELGS